MMTVTAGLLLSAYTRPQHYLTHLVWVTEDGEPIKTGCRVKPEHIEDWRPGYTQDRPTCPTCGRKWDRMHQTE